MLLTLLSYSLVSINSVPYGSMNDLYDTNYEYEFGDIQAREEVLITKTPQFLSEPSELVVNAGHTIRLPCLVDHLEGFVLLWRKNQRIISVGDQIIDKFESRIQLEVEENGNTLIIGLADHSDEAEYVCSVSAYKKTEMKHNVRIRVEPVITTSPREPLTLPEGSPATLSCRLLAGSPIPSLGWRKCDGSHFSTGEEEIAEDVIEIESVTREDSGCYVCEADNGFAQEPVTSKVQLVVEYPPSIQIQKTNDSTEVMTITCTIDSNPRAEVTWFKDGEMIVNASNNLVIHKSGLRNNLNLVALDEEDFGNYSCVAENKLGVVEDSVRISGWPRTSSVEIRPLPHHPPCQAVTVHLYSESSLASARLQYSSTAYSPGWEEVTMSTEPVSKHKWVGVHRLCNLTYSTLYTVRVAGCNSYGCSPLGTPYNFTTDSHPVVKLPVASSATYSIAASIGIIIVSFVIL